jgi:hypothetical protein
MSFLYVGYFGEESKNYFAFHREGRPRPLLVQHAAPGTRPFVHPWCTPDAARPLHGPQRR